MKAIVFREGSQWSVENVETPTPGPGEVRLRIVRTGVCGTDEHLLHGGFIAKLPLIPGHEMLGEVESLGEGVASPAIGNIVAVDNTIHCGDCGPCLSGRALFCQNFVSLGCNAPGGFAEFVIVRAAKTFPTTGLPNDVAVFAEPTACAMHGVDILGLTPASNVLIFGAGPTGLILSQLVRMAGAARVTVAAPTESKLALAREFGADDTVQIDRADPSAALAALKALAPDGFDAVIEATGSTALLDASPALTATGGTIMVYGVAAADASSRFSPYEVFSRELTIKGSFAQAFTMGRAIAALQSGRIRVDGITTDVVGLGDFGRALDNLKDSSQIKTMVDPSLLAS
jgi:D-arabinitol dehydrogenase (NADP+)